MAVAQSVRRWSDGHSVVQDEGSSPGGDTFSFPAMIFISVLLGLMDFSVLVMLCSRPNSCCQQNPKCFDMPLRLIFVFMKE